jgi:hypothetical protein
VNFRNIFNSDILGAVDLWVYNSALLEKCLIKTLQVIFGHAK